MNNSTEMLVDKIDTQGMSAPGGKVDPNRVYPPMKVNKRTVFTDMERKELTEIIVEALKIWQKSEKPSNEGTGRHFTPRRG